MKRPAITYDFFVSYASIDNREGWVDAFVEKLVAEHNRITGGGELTFFLDRNDIQDLSHWYSEIFNKGLSKSRFFLAFLSPHYFASDICRREWKAWIEQEISLHILSFGSAPIYLIEVPGFLSKPMLAEHEVAKQVAKICDFTFTDQFATDLAPVVREARRRQVNFLVQPFETAGVKCLDEAGPRKVLENLAATINQRTEEAARADASVSTIPTHNSKFTGRLEELVELRKLLTDNRAGVIAGIHGLGGMGKTELSYTFAHAYASVYLGGRFAVSCENQTTLRDAINSALGGIAEFHPHISDEERADPEAHFTAIKRCLKNRLQTLGSVLLVFDNVSQPGLLESQETDCLTVLGPQIHLLATTRLAVESNLPALRLGEMSREDSLALLEKFRPFNSDDDRTAAESIVNRLGGFALAIELVAAGLAEHPTAKYAEVAAGLGLYDLDMLAEDSQVTLRRHNHEKRLRAVLLPTLDSLRPAEQRVLEYAAVLPPDHVPLSWLYDLAVVDFPELAQPGRWGDPWGEMWRKLERLALFARVDSDEHDPRLVRVHRLVQELIRGKLSAGDRAKRVKAVSELVGRRISALEQSTQLQDSRWELETLSALANLLADAGHPHATWMLDRAGQFWHTIAVWSQAEPLMRRAVEIDEASLGKNHPKVATDLNNLAVLLQATNRLIEAEPLYRRALGIDEASYGENHPSVALRLSNLASLLQATNRQVEAEPLMRRALAIDEAASDENYSNVAASLNNLAALLYETNRLAEAEPLMRRALAIDRECYGENHTHVARDLNNLASLLQDTSRQAEAEPLLQRVLAIEEATYGKDHPHIARVLNNLTRLLQDANRAAEAEPLMRRALAIDEVSYGENHTEVARDLNHLALVLYATNRLAEAEPLYRRALAIDEAIYGEHHTLVASDLNNLAQLLQAMDRLAEAEPLMRRALAIVEDSYGEYHPDVAAVLNNLTGLLRVTNRLAEAEPLLLRTVVIFLKFTQDTGHATPYLQLAVDNYTSLLRDMGKPDRKIRNRMNALFSKYGLSFE